MNHDTAPLNDTNLHAIAVIADVHRNILLGAMDAGTVVAVTRKGADGTMTGQTGQVASVTYACVVLCWGARRQTTTVPLREVVGVKFPAVQQWPAEPSLDDPEESSR